MIYINYIKFPNANMETNFRWSIQRTCYDSIYPFKVLSAHGLYKIDIADYEQLKK